MLTARGEKIFAPRTGESAAFVGGEAGGLVVPASEVLPMLEIDALDLWPVGRLERNAETGGSDSGAETTF